MVLHHGADSRITNHRRTQASEPKASALAPIRQVERYGGIEKQFRRIERQIQLSGDSCRGLRTLGE